MARVIFNLVFIAASSLALPAVAQVAAPQAQEDTQEYVAPANTPFADARYEALEIRVQTLEQAVIALVEKLEAEKERRQRLEDLLRNADVIR